MTVSLRPVANRVANTAKAAVGQLTAKKPDAKAITIKDTRIHDDGLFTRAFEVLQDAVGGKEQAKKLGLTQTAPLFDIGNIVDRLNGRTNPDTMTAHVMKIPVQAGGPITHSEKGRTEFPLARPIADAATKYLKDHDSSFEGSVSDEWVQLNDKGQAVLSVPNNMVVEWGPFKK